MKIISIDVDLSVLERYYDYLSSLDALLKNLKSHKTIHGGGSLLNSDSRYLRNPIKTIKTMVTINYFDIEDYNIQNVCEHIYMLAKENISQLHKMLFENLEQSSKHTGNFINSKENTISIDLFLDMCEKVEYTFNELGEPLNKTLITNEENYLKLSSIVPTPEQLEREKKIIETKKAEWYVKKRYRKLSYLY